MVYAQQPDGQSLALRGGVGPVYDFEKIGNVTGTPADEVWRNNREVIYSDILEAPTMQMARGRGMRRRQRKSGHMTRFAFFPLRDLSGQPRGAIACKNEGQNAREFTYEDLALIEAFGRAFAPHLAVILADERRIREMDVLAHEMRVPVTAFRAAVERIQGECAAKGYRFQYNHFSEITVYADSMRRLLWDLDLARKGPRRLILDPVLTHLESQIIAPAKRFLVPLLARKGFRESQISYEGVGSIPKLHVDPVLLTQAVLNLLDNAIKYYRGVPEHFKVEIIASKGHDAHEIRFCDNGIGVPPQFRERIFEQWFRAPSPRFPMVSGEGLGLWYAREIAQRHGGKLDLENPSNRTIFLLTLPFRLQNAPPPIETKYEKHPIVVGR
jgi:signal transduction histidine kinase